MAKMKIRVAKQKPAKKVKAKKKPKVGRDPEEVLEELDPKLPANRQKIAKLRDMQQERDAALKKKKK